MSKSSNNPFHSIPNWTATVGGVVGLISVFTPITRDWLISQPLWGWGGLAIALCLAPTAIEVAVRRKVERTLQEDEKAMVRLNQARDIAILQERVADCDSKSVFFNTLRTLSRQHLPLSFDLKLEHQIYVWDGDDRAISDPRVRGIWEACYKAAVDYHTKIGEVMDIKEVSEEAAEKISQGEQIEQYLRIDAELKHNNVKAYRATDEKLEELRVAFERALRSVFTVLHEYAVPQVAG